MQQPSSRQLSRAFFRQEVVELARALIGKVIVSRVDGEEVRARIVQAQAYKAPLDRACHAFGGKKTDRTKYFWLDGGHFYIYTIYSPKNVCLNITAGLEGEPEAVLIRAVQPLTGISVVQKRRPISSKKLEELANGPGKVGQALGIDKDKYNGYDLVAGKQVWVQDDPTFKPRIGISPRVNIDYAQEWIDKPWRFFQLQNKYVSKVPSLKAKPKQSLKAAFQKTVLKQATDSMPEKEKSQKDKSQKDKPKKERAEKSKSLHKP